MQTPPLTYGSDVIVSVLGSLGIKYFALNPGATLRGLHDSLVHAEQGAPGIILCNHEEIAVAIAHGYAKASGEAMAVGLHNIVGLQHATMAIFNAWMDRVPMLLIGGGGPLDLSRRRPWIDWIHTAYHQGELVRQYVKWETQPFSMSSIVESMLRAYQVATTEPRGPVYICFDAELQEQHLEAPIPVPDPRRYLAYSSPGRQRGHPVCCQAAGAGRTSGHYRFRPGKVSRCRRGLGTVGGPVGRAGYRMGAGWGELSEPASFRFNRGSRLRPSGCRRGLVPQRQGYLGDAGKTQ